MKLALTETEKAIVIPAITTVLNGGPRWQDELLHFPVESIVAAILEIPGMTRHALDGGQYGIEGFDTNGWQWDWWQWFDYQGSTYVLSGSGYYGGHLFEKET